ncbi:glutamate 5-kinase [uncultured Limosilactobacillus sp.]|uniref:glutamate 5-kinase n=1 Tax=uncultured Limosilactobacillus sp. TaxID=2837629 RepID=UPI0025E6230F|nr:glutamate 5-kinase [uncultured Limosilactobacillus sp.]
MAKLRQLKAKRIVIKVGTSTLITSNGKVNLRAIDQLSFVISGLVSQGKQVVLVTSGAIGVAMNGVGLEQRPKAIPSQQALAAIGQSRLITMYLERFTTYGQNISQILLTYDVLKDPETRQNALNSIEQLLEWGIVPIVNENDTVSVDEMDHQTTFGDNDQLSAKVADLINADLLIVLSDIDGLYDDNPHTNPDAKMMEEVHEITAAIWEVAGGKGSKYGTGGMQTKLLAAQQMLENGKAMVLINGQDPSQIFDVIAGIPVGTLFQKG